MKNYVILNWKSGELMDYSFNPVKVEEAEIYDDYDYAVNEIESRGEPFCKVIEVGELEAELKKTESYNQMGGVDLYSLKYGQKFKVLQKGWEGKTFVFQAQKSQPTQDRIKLYEESGNEISISGNTAAALKVEVIN
ncbi:MAG TPA: hypothetical protein PLF32_10380 [Bacteroidales bacterium]|nr:hypothetical protein [Bacteroidales bacterium]